MQTEKYTALTLEQLREKQDGERFPFKRAEPTTAEAAEYLKKQKDPEQDDPEQAREKMYAKAWNLVNRPQKQIEQVMDYEEARKLVYYITKQRLAQLGREPVFTDEDKEIYQGVVKYFIGDPSGPHDLNKGIFLFGAPGPGKSFLMETMRIFCNAANIEKRKFKIAVCHNIYDDVQASGDISSINNYFTGAYCFDDLGDEPNLLKSYGNDLFVMQRILAERYRRGVIGSSQTHVTSNLTEEEIEAHYGTRIYDRCKEMFNMVYYGGPSKR